MIERIPHLSIGACSMIRGVSRLSEGQVPGSRLRARGSGPFAASSSRGPAVAGWCAAILLVAALGAAPAAAASGRPATRRVTVAVFGDSVVESTLIPNFLQQGLVPQLSRDVWSLGFAPGGIGLIPAAKFRWHFNKDAAIGSPVPPNGWLTLGFGPLPDGFDGPSGYSALAISPRASATVTVSDPEVEVLYTSTSIQCSFNVTAAGQAWTIETFRHGPLTDTGTWITLPAGRHELTIHGPSCGQLLFDGVVARRPVQPGMVQVEVDDLGHGGGFPSIQFGSRIQQALIGQRYDISVFLFGYLAEDVPGLAKLYLRSVTGRAHIAREHGGACLIVEPTPVAAPQSAVAKISGLDRTVARRDGCRYTTVLAHLWSNATTAEKRGLVLVDGFHPTAAGYTLIAHALAPVIAQMVRAHVQP